MKRKVDSGPRPRCGVAICRNVPAGDTARLRGRLLPITAVSTWLTTSPHRQAVSAPIKSSRPVETSLSALPRRG